MPTPPAPPAPDARLPPLDVRDPQVAALIDHYWARNVRIMAALLVLWALAGLGCGVLFADALHTFHLGGFPLGFWFAQQGSVIVFVVLILVYALLLNRLDQAHHREIERLRRKCAAAAASGDTP